MLILIYGGGGQIKALTWSHEFLSAEVAATRVLLSSGIVSTISYLGYVSEAIKNHYRYSVQQCCGCFWRSRIRILIRLRILPSSSKNSKKNLDFYCFATSLLLFTSVPDHHPDSIFWASRIRIRICYTEV
jgi:hypothetical protein